MQFVPSLDYSLPEVLRQPDIFEVNSCGKERCNILNFVASHAAPYAGHKESERRMQSCEVHKAAYCLAQLKFSFRRRYGIALSLQPFALAIDGTKLL